MIALFLILTLAIPLVPLPFASAHTPPWVVPTYAYLNVSPNPVGVGQSTLITMWLDKIPNTANDQYGDRWTFIVTVTLPSGINETLTPITSDGIGAGMTTYVPTTVGNYTFQMYFPESTLKNANPPPSGPSTSLYINDTYLPSYSLPYTLVVQQAPIQLLPTAPLPTTYWTRPVYGTNILWSSISGNWLGLGVPHLFGGTGVYNASGNFNPYTTAPASAHIMWTMPISEGGQVGGEFTGSGLTVYLSTLYPIKFGPVIMNGILYYTLFPGMATNAVSLNAVDLSTGKLLWSDNTTSAPDANTIQVLRCGQVLQLATPNYHGCVSYIWTETGAIASDSSAPSGTNGFYGPGEGVTYGMYDAMTGNWILNIVNAPMLTDHSQSWLVEDAQGDLIGYFVNSTTNTLNMWNSTLNVINGQSFENIPGTAGYGWTWAPQQGATIPFSEGIQWSVPIPTTLNGLPIQNYMGIQSLEVTSVQSGVVLLQSIPGVFNQASPGWTIDAGYSMATGQLLWGPVNRTANEWNYLFTGCMGNGIYTQFEESSQTWIAYSLTTGVQVWTSAPVPAKSPYDHYGSDSEMAYGNIYVWTLGGTVYCLNASTGVLKWVWSTGNSGMQTPEGVYPIAAIPVVTIADGKVYVPGGRYMAPPVYNGAQLYCLNATTGALIWNIDNLQQQTPPAISDGYMLVLNAYDNQVYCYSKGPSQTTVTAPDIGVTTATPVTITGTVMDISAGSQQNAVAMNFPNGLPCVSDASMSQWMEYVYMQQPCPTNTTGVPVTISVIDSNGNTRQIGTTTSNAYGTYSFNWTPNIPGNYTVIASFAGTQSYYPSSAATAFYASVPSATPAPTAAPLTGLATMSGLTIGIAAAVIAIIIAIAIVGLLLIRKKP